ncbi:MAG: DNA gyrase inhibitor YacG [Pseudomonadota bacterium]
MATRADKVTPLRKPVKCPQCGEPSARANYPFCSARCADLDLGKWLGGGYAIQTDEVAADDK